MKYRNRAFAEEMFSDNEFKLKQIPDIASKSASGNTVTLYKAGDHVDISRFVSSIVLFNLSQHTGVPYHKLHLSVPYLIYELHLGFPYFIYSI